jgi:hypothetical protein
VVVAVLRKVWRRPPVVAAASTQRQQHRRCTECVHLPCVGHTRSLCQPPFAEGVGGVGVLRRFASTLGMGPRHAAFGRSQSHQVLLRQRVWDGVARQTLARQTGAGSRQYREVLS